MVLAEGRKHTMALDQSALHEVLEALKAADVDDKIRHAAETIYQALIEAELSSVIGALAHERTATRTRTAERAPPAHLVEFGRGSGAADPETVGGVVLSVATGRSYVEVVIRRRDRSRSRTSRGRYPMFTTMPSPSAALAVIEPAFSETEKLALAGFLAGYSGMTREAYTLDLRQFTAWCRRRQLRLFAVRRADIELFARGLEAAGRARATITRRLSTIAGLYKYAVEEDLLDHSPAVHVRRLRIDYESHATGLDRNEVGAMLVAAGLGTAADHALVSLLASTGCASPRPPELTQEEHTRFSRTAAAVTAALLGDGDEVEGADGEVRTRNLF
jgi:Phage integrase, N-terminal SAM-like domain